MKFMRGVLLLICFASSVSAAEAPARFEDIFAPLRTEVAALSPDGRHVAYSLREAGSIYIVTVAIDHPEQAIVRVRVADDELAGGYSESHPDFIPGKDISQILWMQWISPTRLAVQTNLSFLQIRGLPQGAIYTFNLDGTDARRIFSAKKGPDWFRAYGLNPANENEILAKSDDGEIAINIDSGKSRELKNKEVKALPAAVKARKQQTRELENRVNADLKKLLPDHKLTLPETMGSPTRALIRAQSAADPGGFLVYEPSANRLWDFVRRTDFLPPDRQFKTEAFEFKGADGHLFSGLITFPLNTRILKAPLVLFMPGKLGARVSRDYRPEIHAFAAMGFAVAIVDGFHASNAIPYTEKVSEATELDHQMQSLDVLAEHYALSRKAVALFGEDLAGRRAIEMVAMRPGRFRCLVALATAGEGQNTARILSQSKQQFVDASLILAWPGEKPFRGPSRSLAMARLATGAMKPLGTETTLVQLPDTFQGRKPAARAEAFRKIEAFLTEHLYHYSVRIGETVELKDKPAEAPR